MIAFIKNAKTFKTVAQYPVSEWEICYATLTNNTGFAVIPAEIQDYTGAWFVMENRIWYIAQSAPEEGVTRLTLSDISEAFNRDIILAYISETTGAFIYQVLSTEFINQPDRIYALPYLRITDESTIPFILPELNEGMFNLSEYIPVARTAGLSFSATVSGDTMQILIADAERESFPLPLSDGKTVLTSAVFSSEMIAKVTVRQKSDDENAIESACDWAVEIAEDDSHGYDQIHRWGPDYDCSSFTITAWQQAGVPVLDAGASYTGNLRSKFLQCGFSDVTDQITKSTGAGLIRGDVLLRHNYSANSGHCALYLGDGKIVHATANEHGGTTGGTTGDQTEEEICVENYYNAPWDYILRYPNKTDATTYEDFTFYLSTSGSVTEEIPENRAIGKWVYTICEHDENPIDAALEQFAQNANAYKIELYSTRAFKLLDTVKVMLPSGNVPAVISEIRRSSTNSMTYYCCGTLPTTLTDKIRR